MERSSRDHARSDDGGDECREAPSQLVLSLVELRCFLDGSADLDGYSFGECPAAAPAFWWRKHLNRIDEAAALILELVGRASPGWQPIESAPRDGTNILAVGPGADRRPLHGLVHWGCRTHALSSAHNCHRLLSDDCGFEWLGGFGERYGPLTHWMPLPQPPESAE